MEDFGGVIEAPEVDSPELELDGANDIEAGAEGLEQEQTEQPEQEAKDDPYSTRFGREYRQYLNSLKTTDPNSAKFVKQARDDYGRAFALKQLDPKGIDGIRENYAMLQAIGGTEGLTGLQERIAGVEAVDSLLAAGDPKAFDELGPDFAEGLAKLAPAYLDRVAQTNPAALEAAILPHLVNQLVNSPMLGSFNSAVDILNEVPPTWLTAEQKIHWNAERMQRVRERVGQMSEWFNGVGQKAGEVKAAPQDKARTEFEAERTKFEQEKQDQHWNSNIKPQLAQHESAKFEELFKPYQQRLKLGGGAKEDLKQAYKAALNKAGSQDQEYLRQMKIYRGQKNPDPTAVTNFVKNAINKHSKAALESLVMARYGSFLKGSPKTAAPAGKPGVKTGPAGPNIEIRSVKPPMSEINHIKSNRLEMAQGIYTLYNGKKIQVVKTK
jgi:hypothetical protein